MVPVGPSESRRLWGWCGRGWGGSSGGRKKTQTGAQQSGGIDPGEPVACPGLMPSLSSSLMPLPAQSGKKLENSFEM